MDLRSRTLLAAVLLVTALVGVSCAQAGREGQPVVAATVAPAATPTTGTLTTTATLPAQSPPAQTAPTRATDTAQPTATKAPSDTPRPTPTPTAETPSDTAQPSPTPTAKAPSDTPRPSPTPTATPTATLAAPIPEPITPANAGRVMLLDRLGTGALQDMVWLPDEQTVVAAFHTGLGLYDAGTLQERQFIPTYGWKVRLAAAPEGRYLALIAKDGVQLWDLGAEQLLQTLAPPSGGARLLALGDGGRVLAVSGSDGAGDAATETVAVWDTSGVLEGSAPGGQLLYRLDDLGTAVSGLAFSRDGAILVTTKYGRWSDPEDTAYLGLWDAATGEPLPAEGDLSTAPDNLANLTFSPDGRLLTASRYSTIYVWEAATGTLVQNLENQSMPNTLALSVDGRWLAAGSSDKRARVWDLRAGTLVTTLAGHTGWVTRVAFGADASSSTGTVRLATATARDGVQLWEVPSGRRLAAQPPIGHTDAVRAIAYSPDGLLLATASVDETVWFWNSESGQPVGMIDAAGMGTGDWCACFWSLAFRPDGKTVATGSTDARVRLWDVGSCTLLSTSQAMGDLVYGLGFSPDGRRLVAGDADGLIWVWDTALPLEADPLLALDHRGVVVSLAFNPRPKNPTSRVFATGSGFGAIRVWDADTGVVVREMEGSRSSVRIAYSPDGSLLAAGDSGWAAEYPVRLWDARSGELRQTLGGHIKDIGGLAFTPDGQILASGDWAGTTRLWDASTGDELARLEQGQMVYDAAFRPDGGRLATAGFDGLIWIWGIP